MEPLLFTPGLGTDCWLLFAGSQASFLSLVSSAVCAGATASCELPDDRIISFCFPALKHNALNSPCYMLLLNVLDLQISALVLGTERAKDRERAHLLTGCHLLIDRACNLLC